MKKCLTLLFVCFYTISLLAQNTSLNFDGTDDVVTVGDINELDGASAFTIETWAKFTSSSSSGDQIFSKFLDGNNNIQFLPRTSDILISIENGSSNFATINHVNSNTWQHYALVYDGSQIGNANRLKLYINGIEQTLNFTGTVPATTDDNSVDALIGAGASTLNQFAGNMDEYRIWSVARTGTEIANNRFKTLVVTNEANLISYYQFEHTDGTTAITDKKTNYNGIWSGSSGSNTVSNFGNNQDPLAPETNLFWAELGLSKIQRSDLNGANVTDILTSTDGLSEPYDVLIDRANYKIYWSDNATDKILRSDIDGSNVETLFDSGDGLVNPAGLVLDLVNNKIYWSDPGATNIKRGNLDGTGVEELFNNTDGLSEPVGLAIDIANNKLYWTDRTAPRIASGDMDGLTAPTVIASSSMTFPMGIELDLINGHIYWSDISDDDIERMDLDGSNRTTIINSGLNFVNNIALDIPNNHLYWTDRGNDVIKRSNLDGSNITNIVTSGLNDPRGIVVVNCQVTAAFSASTVTIGTATTFTDASTNVSGSTTYAWDFDNDGSTDATTIGNATHTYGAAGTYISKLTITDGDCTSETMVSVTVNSIPKDYNIYWTDQATFSNIQQIDSLGNDRALIHFNIHSSTAIALDETNSKVYWTDTYLDRIFRANFDGTAAEDLVTTSNSVPGLALDVPNNKMYWTDSNNGNVYSANLDGTNTQTIITGLSSPSGIDVDLTNSKIYFCEGGAARIKSANLDGTGIQTIITGLSTPRGIEIDETNGKIYWTDISSNEIKRANMNGSSIQLLRSSANQPNGVSLDIANNKMYWTEDGANRIRSANLDGTSPSSFVTTDLTQPYGLAFNSTTNQLFWADRSESKLEYINPDGTNRTQIRARNVINPAGLAIDFVNDKMYWVDRSNAKIVRSGLDGSQQEELITTGLSDPIDIALDVANNLMYWTDRTNNKIQKATLDGSSITDVVTGLSDPMGIVLDLINGKIYWTDQGADKIQRANLDGTTVEDLVTTGLSNPFDIVLDVTNNQMYWSEYANNKIQRADLDGSNIMDIVTSLNNPQAIALDLPRNQIYWTEDGSDKIRKANLNGANVTDVFTTNISTPGGLALGYGCQELTAAFSATTVTAGTATAFTDLSSVINAPTYAWDFDNNGSTDATTIGNTTHTYGAAGTYTAKLTITDGGCTSESIVNVTVNAIFLPEGIYWTEKANIKKSNNNGSNVQTILFGLDNVYDYKINRTNNKIYCAAWNRNSIISLDLGSTDMEEIIIGNNFNYPIELAIDEGNSKIYWISINHNIYRANLNGSNSEVLISSGLHSPNNLTLDLVNNKIYWTDVSTEKIQRANLDGSNMEDLVTTGLDNPQSLALDLINNKMYWSDQGIGKIQRANLDGTSIQDLITTLVDFAYDITLDISNNKMYWRDSDYGIKRANMDGSSIQVIYDDTDGLGYSPSMTIDFNNNKIYWINNHNVISGLDSKIQRADLDGSNLEDLYTTGGGFRFIDLNNNNKLYGINSYKGLLQKSNLDGTNIEIINNYLVFPREIDLDITNGKMYWIDLGIIQRSNLDGTSVEDLVTTGLSDPYGIALDVTNGKMYWTDYGTDKIQRSNLDGTMIEDLVTTGLSTPSSIALDLSNGKMYWTDYGTHKIQRSNLDGTMIEDLVTGLSDPIGIALDVSNGKMYWTDAGTDKIQRANLDGTVIEDVITGLNNPYGIALNIPTILPVSLTYFEATAQENNTSLLQWQTAAEENNKGFNIQRSTDGRVWETIDFVTGNGTTTAISDYTYTDNSPQQGVNYYRLEQVDFDGRVEYSEVRTVYFGGNNAAVAIYPNPFNDYLTIENGQGQLTVFNQIGQVIQVLNVEKPQFRLNVKNWAKGLYYFSILQKNGIIKTVKIVKY